MQDYFAKKDTSTLGQGAELIQFFKNSLLRSRIETTKYEFKQGLVNLSAAKRELNENLVQRLMETICGIANSDPDSDGYIFLGVADKKDHADRIKSLDGVNPVDNAHYFFARSGITNINRIPKTIIARACSVVSRFGLTRYKTAKPSNAIVRFRDSSPGITRVAMMQNAIIAMATSMVPVSLFRVITGRLARQKA
ncbi:RNA-binding domain-containing protein [Coleofasciculus sp. F4-SAH-05]|uniref:RNA-binding domain-containing protein n=1 Tax=Coleofasciculus sp. F4-SAH-05 TaxID=3069525 RepID=UPI0032F3D772